MIHFQIVDISVVEIDLILNLDTDIVTIWKGHNVLGLLDALDNIFGINKNSPHIAGTIDDLIVLEGKFTACDFRHGITPYQK